ncbi:bone morphogenetic protein 1 homolog isoform X2 [Acanthaster planci]|uniref:Metalloendopeptidase n=1 Tax=Acanthaster planci TaxID=133434 RepID=A0A8B7ZB37_ACAPL|nr:bone morphogenetic protein 1 homolog isoform X2 [Acanthaster planci]
MPSRLRFCSFVLKVGRRPRVRPALSCLVLVLTSALWEAARVPVAECLPAAAANLPGGLRFGEGGSGRYGRHHSEESAGGQERDEDAWLACYGEDIYQEDIVMDSWQNEVQYAVTEDNDESDAHVVKVTDGHTQKHPRQLEERQHYRTKKASRVEMDRRWRRDREERSRVRRGATAQEARLWPGGLVPYEIHANCEEDTKNLVLRGMRHWEEHTCIRFLPRINETAYVYLVCTGGCCSLIGRAGARQVVSLGPGCNKFGTIIHELGHVIGFWHEQSRPDRDDYVTVFESNVSPGDHFNFQRFDHRVINSLDQPYDYDSIMHYGPRSFSRNYERTIIPKKEVTIGQRSGLSVGDILQANLLYRCSRFGWCGGTIFKSSGQITSPHYPEPFAPNTTCDWAISVDEDHALKLIFIDIDLPAFDSPLTASSGILKSPNYPGCFPPDTDSVWQITVDEGFIVTLRILELLIPVSSATGCYGDFLKIIDGDTGQSPLITKICQTQLNVGVASSGRSLRVEMHSGHPDRRGNETQPTRFHAKYLKRDVNECRKNNGNCEQACLNMIGTFVCGCQYGYMLADNYRNCTDIDECRDNNGGCSDLCVNTEGAYHCACPEGFYLSPNNQSHCLDVNECDDPTRNHCKQHCYNTIGRYACACSPGFVLAPNGMDCFAVQNCGGSYGGTEGSFFSPVLPPAVFYNTLDCVWRIQVDSTFTISLRIELLNWTGDNLCLNYISFLEGQGPSSPHVQICNHDDAQHVYHTSSNLLWMQSRSLWPHGGAFYVEYFTRRRENESAVCGGELQAGSGMLQSPGYPNAYPNEVHCVWKITGRTIMLHFEAFDVEKEAKCSFDFLDIQDGDKDHPQSRHIGRFCGSKMPPKEVSSSTGEVFIKFQSDATVRATGFRAMFEVQLPPVAFGLNTVAVEVQNTTGDV